MLNKFSNILETVKPSLHIPFGLQLNHNSFGNNLRLEIVDMKAITRIDFYEINNDLNSRIDFVVSFQPLYSSSRIPNSVDSIQVSDLNDQFVAELLDGFISRHSSNTRTLTKIKSSFDDFFLPKF
jgi:hypothetical protein